MRYSCPGELRACYVRRPITPPTRLANPWPPFSNPPGFDVILSSEHAHPPAPRPVVPGLADARRTFLLVHPGEVSALSLHFSAAWSQAASAPWDRRTSSRCPASIFPGVWPPQPWQAFVGSPNWEQEGVLGQFAKQSPEPKTAPHGILHPPWPPLLGESGNRWRPMCSEWHGGDLLSWKWEH